jgi:hypothetical protein
MSAGGRCTGRRGEAESAELGASGGRGRAGFRLGFHGRNLWCREVTLIVVLRSWERGL